MRKYFEAGAPPTPDEAKARNKALFVDYLGGMHYLALSHKYHISRERARQIVQRQLQQKEKRPVTSAEENIVALRETVAKIGKQFNLPRRIVSEVIRLYEASK